MTNCFLFSLLLTSSLLASAWAACSQEKCAENCWNFGYRGLSRGGYCRDDECYCVLVGPLDYCRNLFNDNDYCKSGWCPDKSNDNYCHNWAVQNSLGTWFSGCYCKAFQENNGYKPEKPVDEVTEGNVIEDSTVTEYSNNDEHLPTTETNNVFPTTEDSNNTSPNNEDDEVSATEQNNDVLTSTEADDTLSTDSTDSVLATETAEASEATEEDKEITESTELPPTEATDSEVATPETNEASEATEEEDKETITESTELPPTEATDSEIATPETNEASEATEEEDKETITETSELPPTTEMNDSTFEPDMTPESE